MGWTGVIEAMLVKMLKLLKVVFQTVNGFADDRDLTFEIADMFIANTHEVHPDIWVLTSVGNRHVGATVEAH
jgi:nitrogenase molybdenum-iron protein NifN